MSPAERVLEFVTAERRPYVVSVLSGRIDLAPAEGRRHQAIKADPWRASLVVGVYDRETPLARIEADLAAAGVAAES